MKTLEYYNTYRHLSESVSLIEGQLRFTACIDDAQLLQLHYLKQQQSEIEESLKNYIPYPLSAKNQYRALAEQEFLFYRCIKGLTMTKTAELMCVSRDTVYRIRRRLSQKEGCFADFSEE